MPANNQLVIVYGTALMSRIRFVTVLLATAAALLLWSDRTLAAASCYIVSNDIGYVCDTNPPPSSFGKPVKLHDSIPVSYTHLDVYKRQAESFPGRRGLTKMMRGRGRRTFGQGDDPLAFR